ncbi:MAG: hypothetical protein WCL18_08535 [bacterium]
MEIDKKDIVDEKPSDNIQDTEPKRENVFSGKEIGSILTSANRKVIQLPREEEYLLINKLRLHDDPLSKRLVKYYDIPDLSRKE